MWQALKSCTKSVQISALDKDGLDGLYEPHHTVSVVKQMSWGRLVKINISLPVKYVHIVVVVHHSQVEEQSTHALSF